jgi:hypothetical protein
MSFSHSVDRVLSSSRRSHCLSMHFWMHRPPPFTFWFTIQGDSSWWSPCQASKKLMQTATLKASLIDNMSHWYSSSFLMFSVWRWNVCWFWCTFLILFKNLMPHSILLLDVATWLVRRPGWVVMKEWDGWVLQEPTGQASIPRPSGYHHASKWWTYCGWAQVWNGQEWEYGQQFSLFELNHSHYG